MDRAEILNRVRIRSEPWDIIVIGGGATGVGCAVDAASRGYDVLLVEQHDFGKGTSSRSTKLVHGGVRYLRRGNISLVREALKERGLLLKNAPHVVYRQAFVIPCYSRWQNLFYAAGLKVYDLLSGKYSFGKSRILSKKETIEYLPNIKTEKLSGGVLYYDGQFDDTRLLIDLVKTAHCHGAAILNYTKVKSLTKNSDGKITGVQFSDAESGETFVVAAHSVINATGVFCDDVRAMSDDTAKPVVTFSQGIHLVFDRKFLIGDTAVMIPKTSDGRVLFCIPWHGHTLIGTTDTPVKSAKLEPIALEAEIDFVIETAGQYLSQKPTRNDILSVFAGIRPLIKSGHAKRTSSISRGHNLFVDKAGLVTITGGKWTTYRRMAEDAVNKALEISELEWKPPVTAGLAIKGAHIVPDKSVGLLHRDLPYTRDDVIRAVRDEMAQTLDDVLARRTRALFLNTSAAIEMAPIVARIMADELNADEIWIDGHLAEFREMANNYKI